MEVTLKNVSGMVFKHSGYGRLSDQSLDIRLFNIFSTLDGNRTVETIALDESYNLSDLVDGINELLGLGLIKVVPKTSQNLSNDFIDTLRSNLSHFLGPIADMVLDETLEDLGQTFDNLPAEIASDLIERLSDSIQGEDNALEFKRRMLATLR